MTDPNSAPVSLPVGSYDYETLKKGLDKAAKGKADGYDEGVKTTLHDASETVHVTNDARTIPGYKFVDVENKELGVTENVQVFDPDLAEKDENASGAISEDAPATKTRRAAQSTSEE